MDDDDDAQTSDNTTKSDLTEKGTSSETTKSEDTENENEEEEYWENTDNIHPHEGCGGFFEQTHSDCYTCNECGLATNDPPTYSQTVLEDIFDGNLENYANAAEEANLDPVDLSNYVESWGFPLAIVTYNIFRLGTNTTREDRARKCKEIAEHLMNYDLVFFQEGDMYPDDGGTYKDGSEHDVSDPATVFMDAMQDVGFEYICSPDKTGPKKNNVGGSSCDYFGLFYKPNSVQVFGHSFLQDELVQSKASPNQQAFRYVPYVFEIVHLKTKAEFTILSLHSHPSDQESRVQEFGAIKQWMSTKDSRELARIIILGDLNVRHETDLNQLLDVLNQGLSKSDQFISLNASMEPTSIGNMPYDHIIINRVINRDFKQITDPVAPYLDNSVEGRNTYKRNYSDHHPAVSYFDIPLAKYNPHLRSKEQNNNNNNCEAEDEED